MKLSGELRDDAVLHEIGQRLTYRRVQRELTQAALAEEAGVSKRTIERLEAGESVQLTSLVRVLRRLDLLDALDAALPPAAPGPMDFLARRDAPRQRVRPREPKPAAKREWRWGEDR